MWKIILKNKAIEDLDYLKKYEKSDFQKIIACLQNIERVWWNYEYFKNIGQWVKRVRVWRRRILCTSDFDNICVWIIAIEKDTDKDYQQRKKYILQSLRNI